VGVFCFFRALDFFDLAVIALFYLFFLLISGCCFSLFFLFSRSFLLSFPFPIFSPSYSTAPSPPFFLRCMAWIANRFLMDDFIEKGSFLPFLSPSFFFLFPQLVVPFYWT